MVNRSRGGRGSSSPGVLQAALEKIRHAREQRLTVLNLPGEQLTEIPAEVFELEWLEVLNLGNNLFTTIPDSISRLVKLRSLYLGGNQLSTVPDSIMRLVNLTTLNLAGNQLSTVPESITGLGNLTVLNLYNNQLTTVPQSITGLENLIELILGSNQLTTVPEVIYELSSLVKLDLQNTLFRKNINQIKERSPKILQLERLKYLYLSNNPIETPPPEVVEKGVEAIKDYFRQLAAEGTDYLYEAKLLILGEGGAGKTTLAKKIENPDYQLQEDETSTEGIDVTEWRFPMDNGQEFRINIWDFGGQELYHATHQFFLTKRSLYALVADTRRDDTDFNYWLNVVELLSGDSPLLIVKNEQQDRHREINERQLQGRFGNLKDTLATNLATNRGLPEVLDAIKYQICHLPHIGTALPKTWVQVRETLEKDPRDHIDLTEFLDICDENGFTLLKDKMQLSGYLHDL